MASCISEPSEMTLVRVGTASCVRSSMCKRSLAFGHKLRDSELGWSSFCSC